MADGGLAMDKSPSPPKMDWSIQNSVEMTGSLTDHLQRLLSIKKYSGESSNGQADETTDASIRLKKLLVERDEMWREHERSQIAFMEREHERTLRGLHQEIERLQKRCADLTHQLAETLSITKGQSPRVTKDPEEAKVITDLERQLKASREELTALIQLHDRKQEKLLLLENRCEDQDARHRQELEQKTKQLQEISNDLGHKTALVAQLTTQLHQLRLREAVEKQRIEQRRQLAEQQSKRRQALAAAKADLAPHRSTSLGKIGSPSRSQSIPSKVTAQGATPDYVRRPAARLVTTPPSSARRTRSVALPSIMSTSTPAAVPDGNGSKTDQGTVNTKPVRSLSTTKPPGP